MNSFTHLAWLIIVLSFAHSLWGQEELRPLQIDFSHPGLSKTPTDSKFCLPIRGGFMVPYKETIPGTKIEFEMMPIPGGNFLMGSSEAQVHNEDELPQVQVSIQPFWMGKTEVTWAEYRSYMKLDRVFKDFADNRIRQVNAENKIDAVSAPSMLYDPTIVFEMGEADRQPCATITQYAAKQYTKYLSLLTEDFYRLPTEAEWEYACRAGTKTLYSFGDDKSQLGDYAWYDDNSDDRRHEVARLKPNPWGLYDMHGNVSEWVLDQYDPQRYRKLDFESVTAELAFAEPNEVYPRVVRGGSFLQPSEECRSAARMHSKRDWKDDDPELPQSPWWHTSDAANGAGIRVIRPLHPPVKRADREAFWKADHPEIQDAVETHINNSGRGAFGIVDPQLFPAIKNLKNSK